MISIEEKKLLTKSIAAFCCEGVPFRIVSRQGFINVIETAFNIG